jgi:hypothetical protein
MPSHEQWKLYQTIETAQRALKDCTVDGGDDDYEPSRRLREQLEKVQRLLEEMWAESDIVMMHVSESELRKKKQIADADSRDAR